MTITNCIHYRISPTPSYIQEHFRSLLIGTSDCNNFIPFYALEAHQLLSFEKDNVIEYSMFDTTRATNSIRNFSSLLSSLSSSLSLIKFTYSLLNVPYHVYVAKGVVLDSEGEVLVCLGIDTDYATSTPYATLRETPDYSRYMLFVSKKLGEDKYKNLKKKLEKDYFSTFISNDIDVLQTNRITQWLFKNNHKAPNFKSVKESAQHLKKDIPKLILEI